MPTGRERQPRSSSPSWTSASRSPMEISWSSETVRLAQRPADLAGRASAAMSIRRVARSGRNVAQPDHILANPVMSHEAERRPGSGEIGLAVAEHDGVQVDPILIDQAKLGEAS